MLDVWGRVAPATLYDYSDANVSVVEHVPAQNHRVGHKRSGSQQQVQFYQQHRHPQPQQRQGVDNAEILGGSDQPIQHGLWASTAQVHPVMPAAIGPTAPGTFNHPATSTPEVVALATRFPSGRSRVAISTALAQGWQLLPELRRFQVEMDGVLKQQAPSAWTARLDETTTGMRTFLPAEVTAVIADTFCRGWRRLLDGTLVLIMSTSECPRLTVAQCLVSAHLGAVHMM